MIIIYYTIYSLLQSQSFVMRLLNWTVSGVAHWAPVFVFFLAVSWHHQILLDLHSPCCGSASAFVGSIGNQRSDRIVDDFECLEWKARCDWRKVASLAVGVIEHGDGWWKREGKRAGTVVGFVWVQCNPQWEARAKKKKKARTTGCSWSSSFFCFSAGLPHRWIPPRFPVLRPAQIPQSAFFVWSHSVSCSPADEHDGVYSTDHTHCISYYPIRLYAKAVWSSFGSWHRSVDVWRPGFDWRPGSLCKTLILPSRYTVRPLGMSPVRLCSRLSSRFVSYSPVEGYDGPWGKVHRHYRLCRH